MNLTELQASNEAPEWLTEPAFKKLKISYLLPNETPKGMWLRVANASAKRLQKPEMTDKFFNLFWKGWLGGATPVLANMGTNRGLPISCFSIHVGDSVDNIWLKARELALLSKHGGGVGVYLGDLREQGSKIKAGGTSRGPSHFAKLFDTSTEIASQGNVRRGASAIYLPIEISDAHDFMHIRKRETPDSRRLDTAHSAFTITDSFMHKIENGDHKARGVWVDLMKTRFEEGEHYIFFHDTVQRSRPQMYKDQELKVVTSNICSEILLNTDPDHSFVCCLSSMNLAKWNEWKNTDAVYLATWFLEGVMQEFIDKANNISGFENAVRFAEKGRPLGLGVMGMHTYLQQEMISFDSLRGSIFSNAFAKTLHDESLRASQDMAKELGEPEWCKGYGVRHTHRTAYAPTESNSEIMGDVSPGIEPIADNCPLKPGAQGNRPKYNLTLKKFLAHKGQDTDKVWKQILSDSGSVQNLQFMNDEEKRVFRGAYEINQNVLISLAAGRNRWVCQGQSLNLFFGKTTDPQYFHDVHWNAWKSGIRTLYYVRSESLHAPKLMSDVDCEACQG
jgi:ribonucleoside-diphosphate reductase alpha chain